MHKELIKPINHNAWDSVYVPIDFDYAEHRSKELVHLIEKNMKKLIELLVRYESHEVAEDEISRTLDLLKNIKENKEYFKLRVGPVTSFLPRNQPLYAFACFVFIPSLMAIEVHFRIPQSMKGFFAEMLELLQIAQLRPNVKVSKSERLTFLKERSALLVEPDTLETRPVTDVVIFTGTPVHAAQLRAIFDKRTLFIANGAGHNPVVISKNAKLKNAVEAVVTLQFYNQGQDCAAPNSILVDKAISDKFLKLLRKKISKIKIGEYKDKSNQIGPISDPKDLVRIQDFLVENREWLDKTTPGIIRAIDCIVEPTIILKPLKYGGNYNEIFAPIMFVQEYDSEDELKTYFENKEYVQNAMYITLYGTSAYVENIFNKKILGKAIHDKSTFLHNTHLHAPGIERGTQPYGGYGEGSSSLSIDGKIISIPTLPQRDIFKWIAEPLLQNMHKKDFAKIYNHNSFLIKEKNVEKMLRLQSKSSSMDSSENTKIEDYYIDTEKLNKNQKRYVQIPEESTYLLLTQPNVQFLQSLQNYEVKQIEELKKLLQNKTNLSSEEFKTQLYALPKHKDKSDEENKQLQRNFFVIIYQLLFGKEFGPPLYSFLLEIEEEKIISLLDTNL